MGKIKRTKKITFTREKILNIEKKFHKRTKIKRYSIKEAVQMMSATLHKKMNGGYSIEDLTKFLIKKGVPAAPAILRTYINIATPPRYKKRQQKKLP